MASSSAATNACKGAEVEDWELVDGDADPIGGGWTAVVRTGPEDESLTTTAVEEPAAEDKGYEAESSASASSAAVAAASSTLTATAPVFVPRDEGALAAAQRADAIADETEEESKARRTFEARMGYYGAREYAKRAKKFGW